MKTKWHQSKNQALKAEEAATVVIWATRSDASEFAHPSKAEPSAYGGLLVLFADALAPMRVAAPSGQRYRTMFGLEAGQAFFDGFDSDRVAPLVFDETLLKRASLEIDDGPASLAALLAVSTQRALTKAG